MNNNNIIEAKSLTKIYKLYDKQVDRLKRPLALPRKNIIKNLRL